jgi:hypothetical protein
VKKWWAPLEIEREIGTVKERMDQEEKDRGCNERTLVEGLMAS